MRADYGSLGMYQLRRGRSFTLTTRAGHFLADSTDDRLTVAQRARAIYSARKRIVHGNVEHTNEEYARMAEIASDGTDLARDTLGDPTVVVDLDPKPWPRSVR